MFVALGFLLLEWAVCLAVLVMVLLVRGLGLLAVLRRWVVPVRGCHSGHLVAIPVFRAGLVGLGLFLGVSARFVLSELELVGIQGVARAAVASKWRGAAVVLCKRWMGGVRGGAWFGAYNILSISVRGSNS